jgi:hypothetical protein
MQLCSLGVSPWFSPTHGRELRGRSESTAKLLRSSVDSRSFNPLPQSSVWWARTISQSSRRLDTLRQQHLSLLIVLGFLHTISPQSRSDPGLAASRRPQSPLALTACPNFVSNSRAAADAVAVVDAPVLADAATLPHTGTKRGWAVPSQ